MATLLLDDEDALPDKELEGGVVADVLRPFGGEGVEKVPAADEGSVLGLAEEATAAEAQRHEQGLSKMRKAKDADAERTAKLALRKQQKDAKKQQLLEALRKHKKAAKKPKAAPAGAKAAPPRDSSKKVSFA